MLFFVLTANIAVINIYPRLCKINTSLNSFSWCELCLACEAFFNNIFWVHTKLNDIEFI